MFARLTPTFLLGFAGVFVGGMAIGFFLAPRGGTPGPEPLAQSIPGAPGAVPPQRKQPFPTGAEGVQVAAPGGEGEVAGAILAAARNHDFFQRRHDLYEIGERLSAAELASAMAAAEAFPGPDRDLADSTLLSAWLRKDAEGAMAWVRALPTGSHRHFMLSEAFSGLGRMDAPSALRFFADGGEFESKSERARCLHEIFHGWGESEPAAAAAAVAALPSEEDRENAAGPLIEQWVVRDPRAALAWASQRASAKERKEDRQTVLSEWANVDPAAAGQYAMSLPEGRERAEAIRGVFRQVGEWDMDAALRLVDGVGNFAVRNELLGELLNPNFGTPQQQIRILESIPATARQSYGYNAVARRFAENDPAAALEWAAKVPGLEERQSALNGVLQEWVVEEPRSALDYAMKNSDRKADLVTSAFSTWASRDAQAALAWATALPEGDLRTSSAITAIGEIAWSDPRQALELAGQTLRTAEDQETAFSSIAQTWMQSDLPAVVEWMKRQPDKIQEGLLSNVTREWSRQDPAGAAAWIGQFPKGARRDMAVGAFASAVTQMDPEGAATWATTISDPEQRRSSFHNVLGNWSNNDKTAAAAWLRSSKAVSPQERAALQRWLEENP